MGGFEKMIQHNTHPNFAFTTLITRSVNEYEYTYTRKYLRETRLSAVMQHSLYR